MANIDERFAAYVHERGAHHLRAAVLLTGDWHAAEVGASQSRLSIGPVRRGEAAYEPSVTSAVTAAPPSRRPR